MLSNSIIQMKLKYIDGPYGYARDVKALEIFENAVNNSEWLDENDSLLSGDMVGFNFDDDEVRATVEIGKEIIDVHINFSSQVRLCQVIAHVILQPEQLA